MAKPKDKVVGVAFTAKGRKRLALQTVMKEVGPVDPEALVYTEDGPSRTGTVKDRDGRILGQFKR